jgi:short-subunit dehydrogenase
MLKKRYGNWALITGASSGIGEAFAYRLASEGINLVIVARRIEKLNFLAKELEEKYKINVLPIKLDLTSINFLSELEQKISTIEIGILVNNAGIGLNGYFCDNNIEECKKIIELNCVAPVLLTNYFINGMIKRKKGAVIFVSSTVGLNPTPFMSLYSATKAFEYYLGSSIWYEVKRNNIDILTLVPGSTNTEFPRLNQTGKLLANPAEVVNTALNSLGKKIYVVDGLFNKLLIQVTKFFPKKILASVSGRVTEKLWRKNYS